MAYVRDEIIKQAQSWIGCKESNGSHKKIIDLYNSHKPLARGYKVKYTDHWCATFVSACAIKCGYTAIIPTECSCQTMIELLKKKGIWEEKDSHVPSPGDIIFYDWQDSGIGDNKGHSDHVGIVEKVVGSNITVIEGNYSESVKRRTIKVDSRYIRGYGIPKYTASAGTTVSNTNKIVSASKGAELKSDAIVGQYTVTANLHMRNGAGTANDSMVVLPKGTKVRCYGYYSVENDVRWLYVQASHKGVTYEGFCSSKFLKR